MATVKMVLNKDRKKSCGGYSLVVQLIHKRIRRVLYTPYTLKEEEFDKLLQKAVYIEQGSFTRKQINEINIFSKRKCSGIEKVISTLSRLNPAYTSDDIMRRYRLDQSDKYLKTFCERLIEKKISLDKLGMAKAIRSTQRSLERYIGVRMVEFKDIDYLFVKEYENYLCSTGVTQNTVSFYLRNFQTIYNLAYETGIDMHDNYPFRKIQIRHNKTAKRALKLDIIKKIANFDLSDFEHLERVRDMFMFSFYTRGMCFVDIVHLESSNIVDGVIRYKRRKTNQPLQITVTKPLQSILDKYRGDEIYVLPFLNASSQSSLYKKYQAIYGMLYRDLKELRTLLGITTPLTFHVARHSWATIAKELGASTSAISEGLGHSSEKTTTIYLKEFDSSVIDKINEKVVSFSMERIE